MATDEGTALLAHVKDAVSGRYVVDRVLGSGGAAIVFLAEDLKHKRQVALKVLRPQIVGTIGNDRFLQEIRLAARLTHPHILPLLDSGDAGGLPYYVMPFIDGESLRDRLTTAGRLPVPVAVALAREIADGLDYAHAVGIVHRDIKPENILLMGDHCVVADFGVSRAIRTATDDRDITSIGLTVGTPAYMSPEQAVGESVDGRSDIYSLAIVLFEMLAGEPPFTGPTAQAIIGKRFRDAPARLRELREDVPVHIEDAVATALDLEPDNRYAVAGDFGRALSAPSGAVPSALATWTLTPPHDTKTGETATGRRPPSVAVIPFENLSADPDNEFLCDGLAEEIIATLSKIRQLRVVARMSSFAFKGQQQDARTLGARLKVSNILEGTVRRAGARVRINLRLVDARTGFQLWSDQFERELNDVFAVQDEVAHALANVLKVVLLGEGEGVSLVSGTTHPRAHESYLRGRFLWNKRTEGSLQRAAQHFRDAIAEDPGFSLAHSGLADTLAILGIYGAFPPATVIPLAREAAQRALDLDPTDVSAHVCLGTIRAVYDWNWAGALDAFRRAISIGPWHAAAHHRFAIDYLVPQRSFDDALTHLERARATDPLSSPIAATVGVVRYFMRDFPGAIAHQRAVLGHDDAFPMSHYFLATALRDSGDAAAALPEFNQAISLTGGSPETIAGLAQAQARLGDAAGAGATLDRLRALERQRYVAPSLFAQVHAALGDSAGAIDRLEQAAEVRDSDLIFAALRPAYDSLADHPRFRAVIERAGLTAT